MRQKNAYYKLNDWGVVVKTARVAHQSSVCRLWNNNKKKAKEDPRTNDLFLFAFCFGKCLSMLIFSSHLWQRSQLVCRHDARVLAGVNTPFFSSTHRIRTRCWGRVLGRDLVLGHKSRHRVPVSTQF